MDADDLFQLDEWFSEHGYDDQETRDRVLHKLIMDQVFS
jgi:hypothetical protein